MTQAPQRFAPIADLEDRLRQRELDGLRRRHRTVDAPCGPIANLDGREVLSFCSNDYLGFAGDARLAAALASGAARWGAGSGASHLVSGHLRPHEAAQRELAEFVGQPAALLFSSGYQANLGVLPALLGRGDAVFADKLNHASLIDAAQLSRAEHVRFPHRDLDALAELLSRSPAKRKAILVDAVFSMDGDTSDLAGLFELARTHDSWLIIDDAHGFGVRGVSGRGSLSADKLPVDERIIYMGTLGKAAGLSGAFVAAHQSVIDWLVNMARTHIFTTASIPALSVAISESVRLIAAADDRRSTLKRLIHRLQERCRGLRWPLMQSDTPIQPLLVGDSHLALGLSQSMLDRGFWIPAIRPPTVPQGSARLRISLSATHTSAHIDALADALHELSKDES